MGRQWMRGREQERERGREAGEEDGELVFDDESEYSYVRAVRRHSFALAALHTLAAPGFNPALHLARARRRPLSAFRPAPTTCVHSPVPRERPSVENRSQHSEPLDWWGVIAR